ncbi:hypothetical protein L596_019195 [Steinernema carpocapsae]|uniref:G-protein coupled receptors family 1 profile domain-containing protein n=1 Tax=Steinernema carpocapsae TaxID=34508 RepID=A0A4U5MPK3_STECR|nr:hypothetical protein L596_019195 [Steinernema carpocapsae]
MDEMHEFSPFMYFLILKCTSTLYIVISIIGWIGNAIIIYVTIRSKQLKNKCNILIAIQAFSDMIHQCGHITFVYSAYHELLIPIRLCYWLQFVFFTAVDFSPLIMLFIAIDRLTAAKNVTACRFINGKLFVALAVSVSFAYCFAFQYFIFLSLTDDVTMCMVAEGQTGRIADIWFLSCALVNVVVIAVYGILARMFKQTSVEHKKLNQSLITVIVAHIFGWLFTMVVCVAAKSFGISRLGFVAVDSIAGLAVNVNVSISFFIYYFRSTLYREEFRRVLGLKTETKITRVMESLGSTGLNGSEGRRGRTIPKSQPLGRETGFATWWILEKYCSSQILSLTLFKANQHKTGGIYTLHLAENMLNVILLLESVSLLMRCVRSSRNVTDVHNNCTLPVKTRSIRGCDIIYG